MKTIRLENLSRVYGRSFALHRINTEFKSGELSVLLGHNGAGKTTLMNILATVDRPTSGKITYDKIPFAKFAKKHRNEIGWVSHDALLYNDLSGRENLVFFATMYGVDPKVVDEWLKRVDLEKASNDRVASYSRGMRQRISIARAMIQNPSIVLLDEPLTGLDPQSRKNMLKIFNKLKKEGKILIMITHDVSIGEEYFDRVLMLKAGKIVYDGKSTLTDIVTEFT